MKHLLKTLTALLIVSMAVTGCTEKNKNYTITVKSNNETWGTVLGGGTYAEGMAAEIAARPNVGYAFLKWDDGNTENPRVIAVKSDATYTAIFGEPVTDTTGGGEVPADTNTKLIITFGDTTFHAGYLLRSQISVGGGEVMYVLTASNATNGDDIIVQWLWNGEVGTMRQSQYDQNLCYLLNDANDLYDVNGQSLPHYLSVDNLTITVTKYDASTNSIDCTVRGRLLNMQRVAQGLPDEYVNIQIDIEAFRMTDYNQN